LKYIFRLLFILSFFLITGCEDSEPEPEPTGTLGITLNQPNISYFNDWWDYASKYQIYVNDIEKEVSSFSGFEVTNIKIEPGTHQVGAVITDQNGVWLYSVQKSETVQEDMVTEVTFNNWYRANYPTADYLNEFNNLDDFSIPWGDWSINNSKLYTSNSTPNDHQIEWNSSLMMNSPIRIAIDIETSWNDTMLVGIGLGNSTSNEYYVYFIGDNQISLMYWDGSAWGGIDNSSEVGQNGTILMVFDNDYFHCYLNDDRKVYGSMTNSIEGFDIVNIYYYGIEGASFDNLKVYNSNATALKMIYNNQKELPNVFHDMK
tara:strand:- start:40 stop:990 length:951 start_codon:yes stop_codon:yes gene_type:complete